MPTNKFVPSVDQLTQDVTAIYIDENVNDYDYIRDRIIHHLDETYPENVKGLTYETIISKYRSHIESWNRRNREKEGKGFLSKAESSKRKTIIEFLETRLYIIDWEASSSTPIRDTYLFGDIRQPLLTEQRKRFLSSLKLDDNG